MKIGTNISGNFCWSGHVMFKDAMKMSQDFLVIPVIRPLGFWESVNTIKLPGNWLDKNGYPTVVPYTPPGCSMPVRVATLMFFDMMGLGTGGVFFLKLEGKGQIVLTTDSGNITVEAEGGVTQRQLHIKFKKVPRVFLSIMRSEPGDHIRNIQFIMPGFEKDDLEASPFFPDFVEKIKGFSVLRFVADYGESNYFLSEARPVIKWPERHGRSFRTHQSLEGRWASSGVCLEHMVDLCNTINCDLWLCTGYLWDDRFIHQAAKLIKGSLKPSLRIWLEYSNETWNNAYEQSDYWGPKTILAKFPDTNGNYVDQWTAYRTVRMWEVFGEVFGGFKRLVKVIAGCISDYKRTENRMRYIAGEWCNPSRLQPDILGIDAYINAGMFSEKESVAQVFTACRKGIHSIDRKLGSFERLASERGAQLSVCTGALNIKSADLGGLNTVSQALKHEDMYSIYMNYLNMLEAHKVALFNNANVAGKGSSYAFWGIFEHASEPLDQSPRYRALKDFIKGCR